MSHDFHVTISCIPCDYHDTNKNHNFNAIILTAMFFTVLTLYCMYMVDVVTQQTAVRSRAPASADELLTSTMHDLSVCTSWMYSGFVGTSTSDTCMLYKWYMHVVQMVHACCTSGTCMHYKYVHVVQVVHTCCTNLLQTLYACTLQCKTVTLTDYHNYTLK